jgi:photosystem II stability/assembly factor-like uncharacterized protein
MRRIFPAFSGFLLASFALVLNADAQTPVWTQFLGTPLNNTLRHDDVIFVGQTNGWSARGIDGVYRTTNGGQTWTKVIANTNPVAHFRSIGFASPTRGWAGNLGPGSYDGSVTDTNMLYETFDGGANWSVVPAINDSGMKGFCAMHVMDAQHIYGVGRVRGPAYFAKSENGGTSWSVTNLTAAGVMGGLMDVYFKDSQTGFIVGMNTNLFTAPPYFGSIARTTNGGLSWQVLVTTTVTNSYFWKMSWPSVNVGYASLQQNSPYNTVVFYKTTDGGATWISNGIPLSAIGSPASFGLQGIGFVSETEGWMGGSSSLNPPYTFIHTTDGGLTWTPEGYSNTRSINRIRFASPTLGYMSGQTLHVYHVPLAANITPTNPTVPLGSNVTFTATAFGTVPLQYQWRSNGTNLAGANASTLPLANIQVTNAGNYDVVVSDFSGSITSSVSTLTISGLPVGPTIIEQPQSQVISSGSNAMFSVKAAGTPPLFYQWRFNGGAISGATNAAYTRTNAQLSHAGNYTVRVTNLVSGVTSEAGTLAFAFGDNFDGYAVPVIVTNLGTTNGYKIFFNAASGPLDFKAIFGFDYSTVSFPTTIPAAPNSAGGTTRGLYLTVNKDANGQNSAVNLYPTNNALAGNFALKFDLWMNWANLGSSTEHALFGLNHSGNVTNRIGLAGSDGLFFAVDADGNVASTGTTLRDYSVYRGSSNAAPVFMITDGTTFGPTPPLGANFDNLDSGIASLFPAKLFVGWSTSPAGSIGLGWVGVEVRQVNNLITWLLNGKAIAQYTNTTDYTHGSIMIGYNDAFGASIGDINSFAIIDNLRVDGITISPVQILAPSVMGNQFHFSFATEAYERYSVQWTTNLTNPSWATYTNFVGSGSAVEMALPLDSNPERYFRISRP